MFRSLATALSLYGEVIERMKSEFQEDFSSGEICGYLDQQKLNIMHKLVDRCMPHHPHCRAAAYTLIKADEYGDPNDFYIMAGGLFDAIESAEFELNQMELQQKYSGIEEFPSN